MSRFIELSRMQQAAVREARTAAGARPASAPAPARRSIKYNGVRFVRVPARAGIKGAHAGDLLLTTLRKRDRTLEVIRVERDGTRHLKRYALAPRTGLKFIPLGTNGHRVDGLELRTLLFGAEFKTEAVARDVCRVFGLDGKIAVVQDVPSPSVMGMPTFERKTLRTLV